MINNSEQIIQLVKQAYENLNDPHIRHWDSTMDNRRYREQFGTVRIGLQRGTGHTTAAVTLLSLYPGSILFVPEWRQIITNFYHVYDKNRISYHKDDKYKCNTDPDEQKEGLESLESIVFTPQDHERLLHLPPVRMDNKRPMVILDRAGDIDFLYKEGIMAMFSHTTRLFVELQ